jgi:carboxymethylenebutenolidase
MNRREFAGMAAGVTAAASMPARTIAQPQPGAFGRPHPPIVPENDPAITVERLQIRRPDGMLGAYAAFPRSVRPNTPGIAIAMAIWGVDEQLRDTVRRFAKAGFSCIAPDLYSRMNAPSGDGQTDIDEFKPFAAQLQRKQYDGDMRASGLQLLSKAPQGKLGVTGFCMGGHLALIQALDNSDVFDAVAPFYGAIKDIDPTEIHIPVCGSYGEKDASIPADEVRTWRGLLRVANDVRVYPSSGHAFFDDTRSSYVASAADDAWKRTIKFFSEILGLQK